MKKERNKLIGTVALMMIIGWTVITCFVYGISNISDIQIKQNYEEREEKIELLKQIPYECIIERERIAFDKIQDDNVKYKISNENETIILNYWIEPEKYVRPDINKYRGKITLTKDYKIINKEIQIESITFDKYKEDIKNTNKMMSVFIAGEILFGITLVIYMIFLIKKRAKGQA